jgi:glucose/arabinose dehydrogenase
MQRQTLLATVLLAAIAPSARAETSLTTTRVASGLARPVFVTAPPNDFDRLFILEQHTGEIKILDLNSGLIQPQPFLTVGSLATGNEQGLLGMAFHPNYAENGLFYVDYTDETGRTNVRRFQTSTDPNLADAGSGLTVLTIAQPQSNHNGGWIGFGPSDGFLYISSGDGGGGNDTGGGHTSGTGNAQDTSDNLLGKMLRIDVDGDAFPGDATRNYAIPPSNPFVNAAGDDEIWAFGLRNPWRASFDRQTHDLYIGDVGQISREEIDFQSASSSGGENYGWRLREGTIPNPADGIGGDPPAGAVEPIYDYARGGSPLEGSAVTGGYVYRGPIEDLHGKYIFGDYGSSQIWSFEYDGATRSNFRTRTRELAPAGGTIDFVASFGEDARGNVYVVDLGSFSSATGEIFRIDADPAKLVPPGAAWKYLDDGSNQMTAWREIDFDDSAWPSGGGEFGYGDDDETTTIDCGASAPVCNSNNRATTYFRHTFSLDDPSLVAALDLALLRDDGAAVFLNGEEITRTANLAPDAPFNALANFNGAAAVDGANERTYFHSAVDPALLLQGENVLAVEVHQHSLSSSDVSFDLVLAATFRDPSPGDVDFDGQTTRGDLAAVALNFGQASGAIWTDGDFNADGQFSLIDLALLQASLASANANAPLAVPEPATATLILFAIAIGVRRRRR